MKRKQIIKCIIVNIKRNKRREGRGKERKEQLNVLFNKDVHKICVHTIDLILTTTTVLDKGTT